MKAIFYVCVAVFLGLISLLAVAICQADQVQLAWDPTSDDADGYYVYKRIDGTLFDYTRPVNKELITGTTYTVDGLADGEKYFFTVRAVRGDNTSGDSNVVSLRLPNADVFNIDIDNLDPNHTSFKGTWKHSSGTDPYGDGSLYSKLSGDEYTFDALSAGDIDVFLWWSGHASRSKNVEVSIYDGDKQLATEIVDQSINSGKWNHIGKWTFEKSARVSILSSGDPASTSADAVRFSVSRPDIHLLQTDGALVYFLAPGSYLIEDYPDLSVIIRPVPEGNDNPPWSLNGDGTIYHGPTCRWYDPKKGVLEKPEPPIRVCKKCGGR